jgi:hypothetical protein
LNEYLVSRGVEKPLNKIGMPIRSAVIAFIAIQLLAGGGKKSETSPPATRVAMPVRINL